MSFDITQFIGSLATLTLLLGYLPQTIHTIRTAVLSAIIFGIKMYNDHFKKKF